MEVDNLEEEGVSVTSGAHDDCGALFEGESSSEGECDDAGVPITWNYHLLLNGMLI